MLISLIILVVGFAVLAFAADRLIGGAAALARHYGVSPLLVGVTIVALGTSLPEIVVALQAAIAQNPGLAIGNALGSNIANIGLVFGLCACIKPITAHSRILEREFPILIIIMCLTTLLIGDGDFVILDGVIMLAALVSFIAWLYTQVRTKKDQALEQEYREELPKNVPLAKSVLSIVIGIVLLPLSAHFIVDSATYIAKYFGISDLIIGLTLLALGTSLPEVATAIAATLKKEYDLVLGNILGSNIFNLLAVLPLPALFSPSLISRAVLLRDVGFMFVMTLLFYLMITRQQSVTRTKGLLLISGYVVYIAVLFLTRNNPDLFIRTI